MQKKLILSPFVYDFRSLQRTLFAKTKFTTKPEKLVLPAFRPQSVSLLPAHSLSISITYGLMSRQQFPSLLQEEKIQHNFIYRRNKVCVCERKFMCVCSIKYQCMLIMLCLLYAKQVKPGKSQARPLPSILNPLMTVLSFEREEKNKT